MRRAAAPVKRVNQGSCLRELFLRGNTIVVFSDDVAVNDVDNWNDVEEVYAEESTTFSCVSTLFESVVLWRRATLCIVWGGFSGRNVWRGMPFRCIPESFD